MEVYFEGTNPSTARNDVKVKLTDEKVIQFLMSNAKINEVKPKDEKKKQKKDKS